jgi:DNA polymerase (family 10)
MTPEHAIAYSASNVEISRALRELALYAEMDDVPFKPQAYESAAASIESLDEPVALIYARGGVKACCAVPHVGKGIAARIEELLTAGRIGELDLLRSRMPVDLLALTRVEGLGPKMARTIYEALGVRTLEELEAACKQQRVRQVPRLGVKTEEKILRGLAVLAKTQGRIHLGDALTIARRIEARLRALSFVDRVVIAGSVRRRKETIGDLDFLVVSSEPMRVMEAFVQIADVKHAHARGSTKTSVLLHEGIDADLRVVPEESFGAALAYFTGSKAHNVALRKLAIDRDLKLNEYGLFRDEASIAGKTEEEVYAALDLPWIPPELREESGEIEAARAGTLPALIPYGALLGDLQTQTNWTDGAFSIEQMARAAMAMGYEYIAITDHTRDLPMARGSDEERLRQQAAEIRRVNDQLHGFRVLSGAEVNIRKDGSLDIDDSALAALDVVGASIHHFFHLPREEMTQRVLRAIENPNVDILFHPTARSIGKRDAVDVDMDAVIAAAARTGTILEIDALPDRMDLRDELVRRAIRAGVKLAVDSDAHHVDHFALADQLGIAIARRGWATKEDVINTRPLDEMLALLKDRRAARS